MLVDLGIVFFYNFTIIISLSSFDRSTSAVLEECYEFLYLVSSASEDGVMTFYESAGIKVLASHMPTFPDGTNFCFLMLISCCFLVVLLFPCLM